MPWFRNALVDESPLMSTLVTDDPDSEEAWLVPDVEIRRLS